MLRRNANMINNYTIIVEKSIIRMKINSIDELKKSAAIEKCGVPLC